MNNTRPLCALFKDTINKFLLPKNEGVYFYVEEQDDDKTLYEIIPPSMDCFAFNLDAKDNFNVFGGSRLEGVAMRCDVVFVVHMNGEDYIIVTEFKSGNKGDYKKQLSNGRHFCQWVVNLLKEHGYYCQNPKYIGLLVWKVNPKQPPKRPSVRGNYGTTKYKGIPIHDRTVQKIYLRELIV